MTVRLRFVGAGGIAVEHLGRLVREPEVEIVAVADPDTEARRSLAGRVRRRMLSLAGTDSGGEVTARRLEAVRACPGYADAADLLTTEAVDAVFVCVPPYAHGPAEHAALEAGVALFVEKPVALDLGLAVEVRQQLAAAGRVSGSGYQSRASGVAGFLREKLAGRTVGMVLAHRYSRLPNRDWYHRQDRSGGQVVEMTTHQIDLLRLLAGEVDRVGSVGARRVVTDGAEEVFDVQAASLVFATGAIGSVSNNLISAHGTPAAARGIHVFAEGLTVSVLGHEGEHRVVQLVDAEGRREVSFDDDSMAAQDRSFVRAVAEGRPTGVASDYANGVATLAVTLAMHESARTGRFVQPADLLAGTSG
jgi:myo-inositol 2-dehydrogenase/D-chiro-inositol 1-dehydrogenase